MTASSGVKGTAPGLYGPGKLVFVFVLCLSQCAPPPPPTLLLICEGSRIVKRLSPSSPVFPRSAQESGLFLVVAAPPTYPSGWSRDCGAAAQRREASG